MRINDIVIEELGWTVTHEVIGSPEPRIYTAQVIGKDGLVDLSEVATGRMQYNNRVITVTLQRFINHPRVQYDYDRIGSLHGLYADRIVMNSDPQSYYKGRITLSGIERSGCVATITMTISAEPSVFSFVHSASMYNLGVESSFEDRIPVSMQVQVIKPEGGLEFFQGMCKLHIVWSDGSKTYETDTTLANGTVYLTDKNFKNIKTITVTADEPKARTVLIAYY